MHLAQQFAIPLQSADADVEEMHAEFEAILQYVCQYVSLSTLSYQAVCWHLFHAPVATEWINILTLVELPFSLPVSNGKIEKVYLQVNVIKSSKRSQLSNEALDYLLILTTAGDPLNKFNPDHAIDVWLKQSVPT